MKCSCGAREKEKCQKESETGYGKMCLLQGIDSKTIAAIKSTPSTTTTWFGGFRFDCPQDDDKFYSELKMAEKIVTNNRSKEENDPEEVDKASEVGENESRLDEKDRVFRDSLVVLLDHVEIHTSKIDELLTRLKEMK